MDEFCRFDSYDFEADGRFSAALRGVEVEPRRLLEMKLTYYNRFVEPIDGSAYVSRLRCAPPPQGAPAAPERLSLAELARLVQEGRDVPGVEKLDVRPSELNPTPSMMAPRPKPWDEAPR